MEFTDGDSASVKDVDIDEGEDRAAETEHPSETETKSDPVKIDDFDPKTDQLVEPAKFAPKDLLALLRNVEAEIHQVCAPFLVQIHHLKQMQIY